MTRTRARANISSNFPFQNHHRTECFQWQRGKIRVLPMCLISVKRAKISGFTWLTRACARTSVLKCARTDVSKTGLLPSGICGSIVSVS